jgi:hypothetical protein
MFIQQAAAIEKIAIAESLRQKEAIGVQVDGVSVQLTNMHPHPEDNVLFNPHELASFTYPDPDLIWHSHWKESHEAELSPADIWMSHRYGKAIALYHVLYDSWDYYDPSNPNPFPLKSIPHTPKELDFYTGWRFYWQRSDCFSLVYRYFLGRLGVDIEEFQRPPSENGVLPVGYRITWNPEDHGFMILPDGTTPQRHDIFGIAPRGGKDYSHIVVLVSEEANTILHSPGKTYKSELVNFGSYWRSRVVPGGHARHKSLV